jgi:hypothetical protein
MTPLKTENFERQDIQSILSYTYGKKWGYLGKMIRLLWKNCGKIRIPKMSFQMSYPSEKKNGKK